MVTRLGAALALCLAVLSHDVRQALGQEADATAETTEAQPVDPIAGIVRPLPTGFLLQTCDSQDLGTPSPARISGCESAHCIQAESDLRICRCAAYAASWIRVTRGVTELARIATADDMMTSSAFNAATIDLDSDGQEELVIGARSYFMCGSGAESWLVAVVELDGIHDRPLTFWSGDFGPDAFVRVSRDQRCAVLTTSHHNVDFLDNRLVGRPMHYESNGSLRPATDLPLLVVPLESVSVARYGADGSAMRTGDGPRTWLTLEGARMLTTDIPIRGVSTMRREVVISSVHDVGTSEDGMVLLDMILEEGRERSQSISFNDIDDSSALSQLGDGQSSRLFPAGYFPLNTASIAGRRARIETFDTSAPASILWLD